MGDRRPCGMSQSPILAIHVTLLPRRRFLLGAACSVLAPAVGFPAIRLGPAAETPLRHIVLLMRENRSFDHYLAGSPARTASRPAPR